MRLWASVYFRVLPNDKKLNKLTLEQLNILFLSVGTMGTENGIEKSFVESVRKKRIDKEKLKELESIRADYGFSKELLETASEL